MKPALLVCLGALLLSGCARPPSRRILVATVRQPATSLLFAAQTAGCFAREGLTVEERTFELGRDALALLARGGAEAAVGFETPVLAAFQEDPSLRVLTTLHSSTRNTRLIARADSGIAAFDDLAGKRIGAARGTNADYFLEVALEFGGVRRADVRLADLSPAESIRELRAGALDATILSDPPASEAEEALAGTATVLRSDLYVEFSLLVARRETIERRRPELEALLRGLGCAERLARDRPEVAVGLVRERFPELPAGALRAQIERVGWGLGLGNLLAEALRRESDWAQRAAAAPGAPVSTRALLEPGVLEAAEPDAVTLLPDSGW